MKNILIANPKGGSGKTTLATNLAGFFANGRTANGRTKVALQDLDRQQSSQQWLKRRASGLVKIAIENKSLDKYDWVITDSPAGLRKEKLEQAVKQADCVLVPVQPSAFDMGATQDFLEILAKEKAVRKNKTFVGLVGTRVNSRTKAAEQLAEFMSEAGFPVLTYLRNSQNYVRGAEHGTTIFDMRPSLVEQDLMQWNPLLNWLKKELTQS